jgi:hypothetical protein
LTSNALIVRRPVAQGEAHVLIIVFVSRNGVAIGGEMIDDLTGKIGLIDRRIRSEGVGDDEMLRVESVDKSIP